MENKLDINSFKELYSWLEKNHNIKEYIWVNAKRGRPNNKEFNYIDAVYCALCFGWIDSTCKNIEGKTYQKLMPRSKNSHWSYLNIERCNYLIEKGLMKKQGIKVMPKYFDPLEENKDIIKILKGDNQVWKNFNEFPKLYQRIRIDNIIWAKKNKDLYNKRLAKLIQTTRENKMYGQWNDYGKLKEE